MRKTWCRKSKEWEKYAKMKKNELAGGEGDEKNKQKSHNKHKKVVFKKDGDYKELEKKSEKISLVCISFRRVQGREMKK